MEVVIGRVQQALAETVDLPQGACSLRALIGAAVFPFDAKLPQDLLDAARGDAEMLLRHRPAASVAVV